MKSFKLRIVWIYLFKLNHYQIYALEGLELVIFIIFFYLIPTLNWGFVLLLWPMLLNIEGGYDLWRFVKVQSRLETIIFFPLNLRFGFV